MLQDITYVLPTQEVLFQNININLQPREIVALIGKNGVGKSTLMKIVAGVLEPISGQVIAPEKLYYVPQVLDQYHHLSVAEALGISAKLNALQEILKGNMTETNLEILADDWGLEERCTEAFAYWGLKDIDLNQKMAELSGGQRVKVMLSGINVHEADLILLDEPTNHLDTEGRRLLYTFLESSSKSMLMISHDRDLLSLAGKTIELTRKGVFLYGGNYDFYLQQKNIQLNALEQDVQSKEKELKKAKEKERETLERQQKLDAKGKKKQEKAGVSRIMMNTLRNNAEKSTSKLKGVHEDKIAGLADELRDLRSGIPDIDKMKFGFEDSGLHKGKILFSAENLNWKYGEEELWTSPLNLQIKSGDRLGIKGRNGSGKSTLMKIIMGDLVVENSFKAVIKEVYIDQDYALLDNSKTVYEQVVAFSEGIVAEHAIKMNLHRLLFLKEDWNKPCEALSGGERMRLALCCLTVSGSSPDLIILDEPTNNLDLQNIEILTRAIQEYRGTLLVISHDLVFLKEIGIEEFIELS